MVKIENGALRLFRAFGISVYLHWAWALVAFYEFLQPVTGYSSRIWNMAEYLTLFAIVLTHEFGHALACRSVGGKAERILLWPLGGIAYVSPPQRPGAVLWSIVAGPLVNVVLLPLTLVAMTLTQRAGGDVAEYFYRVAFINGALLIFNLLPIYPLDGGQILQSLLWFMMGQARSLMVAAGIGLLGAAGLVVLGLAWGTNVWLIVIAVFVGMQSWRGFQQAKWIAQAMAVPRRPEARCPACGEHPPAVPIWQCVCGQAIDIFAHQGICPVCGKMAHQTSCPSCRQVSPIGAWFAAIPAGTPQVITVTAEPSQRVDPPL